MLQKRHLTTAILVLGLSLATAWPTIAAPIDPLKFQPDLVALPGSIAADGTVTFVVKNQGRAWAGPSTADVTYDASNLAGSWRTFRAQVATPALAIGQYVTLRVKPALPDYKFCAQAYAIADVSGRVAESSESNNKSSTFYGGTYDYRICIN